MTKMIQGSAFAIKHVDKNNKEVILIVNGQLAIFSTEGIAEIYKKEWDTRIENEKGKLVIIEVDIEEIGEVL